MKTRSRPQLVSHHGSRYTYGMVRSLLIGQARRETIYYSGWEKKFLRTKMKNCVILFLFIGTTFTLRTMNIQLSTHHSNSRNQNVIEMSLEWTIYRPTLWPKTSKTLLKQSVFLLNFKNSLDWPLDRLRDHRQPFKNYQSRENWKESVGKKGSGLWRLSGKLKAVHWERLVR